MRGEEAYESKESRRTRLHRTLLPLLATVVALIGCQDEPTAEVSRGARYEVDPAWPKLPLGERWITGGLGGMCIDGRDHVFILNRQNVAPEDLDGARMAPPGD